MFTAVFWLLLFELVEQVAIFIKIYSSQHGLQTALGLELPDFYVQRSNFCLDGKTVIRLYQPNFAFITR